MPWLHDDPRPVSHSPGWYEPPDEPEDPCNTCNQTGACNGCEYQDLNDESQLDEDWDGDPITLEDEIKIANALAQDDGWHWDIDKYGLEERP